ncbi:MAG: rhodanese-like domain-containing protein [Salibacteraceae bacterium]|nr:rhodanese-like domain-containing protein [Salibacteraceae bacterium]
MYCRSGGRSSNAQNMMKSKGFTTVYNLAGGYMNWPAK